MGKKQTMRGVFINGVLNENPVFRLVLGVCPILAATTSATNGLGMGVAATFVLLGSNIVISLLRNFIPAKVRIPAYIVVISTFVTVVQMLIQAFVPSLYDALGIFIPLIVVNCIILARAEAFAGKNSVLHSAADGLGMGLGFTLALILIGMVREIIGNGSVFGLDILGPTFQPMLIAIMAPGGFILFGLILGIVNSIVSKIAKRSAGKGVKA
ncbi:MAG: electron transport complex subunit E [Eubacteriales bacterium]|jgi:electron transport complex protein RnfE|nr:electron transport complex subunit E [Eubacteriales bacterium]MDD4134665.1 electron transport complex subunit E [Eubacteriales bacterium]NLO13477.1 electron transport complex subunit E [Clostridiales bacterium]